MTNSNNSCDVDYSRYTTGYRSDSFTGAYSSWRAMRVRCLCTTYPSYPEYGGRGVTICQRWDSYDHFFEDMGHRPNNTSLDKDILSNGDGLLYSPETCMWATAKEQSRHRRYNVTLTFNGKTQCISAWAEELEISSYTIRRRMKRNLPLERILSSGTAKTEQKSTNSMSHISRHKNRYLVRVYVNGRRICKYFKNLIDAQNCRDSLLIEANSSSRRCTNHPAATSHGSAG